MGGKVGTVMAYLSDKQLAGIGFAALGDGVRISDRAVLYEPEKMAFGDFSRIDDFCIVSGSVRLGRNVHVAAFSNLAGGLPGIVMEDFSGLAYGCQIIAQSDDYSGGSMTNPTVPRRFKHETFNAVSIGRHAILGTYAIVFPGCDIAEGCAVGAGAIVTKPTTPWGIYAGNPARRVKERKRDLLEMEKDYLSSP